MLHCTLNKIIGVANFVNEIPNNTPENKFPQKSSSPPPNHFPNREPNNIMLNYPSRISLLFVQGLNAHAESSRSSVASSSSFIGICLINLGLNMTATLIEFVSLGVLLNLKHGTSEGWSRSCVEKLYLNNIESIMILRNKLRALEKFSKYP